MTTFETEKHNIPEGATHYYHNLGGIGFYRLIDNSWEFWHYFYDCWKPVCDNDCVFEAIPIPQTNIETPEEKEALDSIKSVHLRDYQKADKPHVKVEYEKVTESIFDLREEFERGELHYDFGDENWFTFNDEASLVAGFKEGNVYRRIETQESPQQREERERSEWIERFAHKVKHVGTITYKDILGEMCDSLKGESK